MLGIVVFFTLLVGGNSLDKTSLGSYQDQVNNVLQFKNEIVLEDSLLSKNQRYLDSLLVEHIFPHWYKTDWDFNGYSNVPGKGQIACGYFVSTPLKHIGFNWNRFRLAQKDATTIIKKISGDSTKFYWNKSPQQFLKLVDDISNGLYVIGFDSHVGFLHKHALGVSIIHSSYYGGICVMTEDAANAPALYHSNSFVLGRVFTKENIRKWKNNEQFKF